MRIVELHEFLTQPTNTLFAEYTDGNTGELRIKGEPFQRRQFYFTSLANQVDAGELEDVSLATEDLPVDHSQEQLSPVYADHQRFVIYSDHDLAQMGKALRQDTRKAKATSVHDLPRAHPGEHRELHDHLVEHKDQVFTHD